MFRESGKGIRMRDAILAPKSDGVFVVPRRRAVVLTTGGSRSKGTSQFVVGPPVADPRRFFGRRDIIKRVFGLWKAPPLQNAAILGATRTGKTSLLLHLRHLATSPPAALRPDQVDICPPSVRARRWAWVDFQDPRMGRRELLLRHLLSEMGLPAPEPCTLERFCDVVESGLRTPTIVLLDEVTVALSRHRELDDELWDGLRALATRVGGNLGFVLAAHESPYETAHRAGLGSPFFNIFGYTATLGPLTEADARAIVASSPAAIPEGDAGWIVETSKGWPILVQLLCRERLAAFEEGVTDYAWRAAALRQMEPFRALLERA